MEDLRKKGDGLTCGFSPLSNVGAAPEFIVSSRPHTQLAIASESSRHSLMFSFYPHRPLSIDSESHVLRFSPFPPTVLCCVTSGVIVIAMGTTFEGYCLLYRLENLALPWPSSAPVMRIWPFVFIHSSRILQTVDTGSAVVRPTCLFRLIIPRR